MILSFMGTGTSQGVPMIGCDCQVCQSSDPRNTRYRTHAHLRLGKLNIQIDAAPEFRLRALEMGIPKVDLVLLTHGHADHIQGFDDLRQYCDQRGGEAIPVYSNADGLSRLKEVYPYAIRDKAVFKSYPAFRAIDMPQVLELGNEGRIYSTVQDHGRFETLGFVFEEASSGKRLAYFTDCSGVSEEAERLAKGADLVVLDGLRPMAHPSHMTIGEAVEAAQRIGGSQTYLIHMTHHIDHGKVDTELPEGINLSYDKLVVEA
ncbi:MBL fold metallo-hydrolase [Pelagicoccus sp. NFK12]|uniref:MBL fold metallo-hydrolase n=1 Tax=Pelagicoccus enzymogenes TaxID=2773457 RepID=A0A927F750_9BACT|nr:MBL fold metallo-hydrolase [Pelagicoccus enzymogenes]MBD5779467.1 MBL fold metallo-hydrolase [Pelagicoccus enzymogenes]MDQ8201066.1 MBL fold metallo-hydrolase [Pelagicoccus enzymogenes]